MKYFLIPVFFWILTPTHGQDFTLFNAETYHSADGKALPYRILYPKNYDRSRTYPLVLFLHGGGERGDDNEKQLLHGVKVFLEPEAREQYPCLVVAPQCPVDSYWASVKFNRAKYPLELDFNYRYEPTEGLRLAVELLKSLIDKEQVDTERVFITGLSMGGMGTFEAVYRFPELFAAAIAVCGGADTTAYEKHPAKIPFWIFHGAEDGVIAVEHSRKIYQILKAQGADVKYTEYPGVNHNSWEKAYAEPDLLPWLFNK